MSILHSVLIIQQPTLLLVWQKSTQILFHHDCVGVDWSDITDGEQMHTEHSVFIQDLIIHCQALTEKMYFCCLWFKIKYVDDTPLHSQSQGIRILLYSCTCFLSIPWSVQIRGEKINERCQGLHHHAKTLTCHYLFSSNVIYCNIQYNFFLVFKWCSGDRIQLNTFSFNVILFKWIKLMSL